MTLAKKNRAANLDLLRIVSMLLIVLLHSVDHSGVLENTENCGIGMQFYVRFIHALCMVCVNIYVMLSGYFMVNSKFRLQKLVALWMETAFYAVVLKLVFMLTGAETFSLISLVSCFVPTLTGRYWFLTIYVGMYLLSPFINILIHAMNKRQHGLLNVALFLIMSVWVSIHPSIAGMNSGGGWGLAWFVVLYLAAAWLRLYYVPNYKPTKWLVVFLAIPLVMAAMYIVFAGGLGISVPYVLFTIVKHWLRYDSAPVYFMTMGLFIGFLNVRIPSEKLSGAIVQIAPLTLGVYLIHAHANVSPWSWEVLNLPSKMDTALFPIIQIASVVGIFVICAMIDMLRSATVGKLEEAKVLSNYCNSVQKRIESLIGKG